MIRILEWSLLNFNVGWMSKTQTQVNHPMRTNRAIAVDSRSADVTWQKFSTKNDTCTSFNVWCKNYSYVDPHNSTVVHHPVQVFPFSCQGAEIERKRAEMLEMIAKKKAMLLQKQQGQTLFLDTVAGRFWFGNPDGIWNIYYIATPHQMKPYI